MLPLEQTTLAKLTAEIVSAYVSSNQITPSDLGMLVSTVGSELGKVGTGLEQSAESGSKPEPAVPVRRSIASDHLVCLVCGKKQKLLKRHLSVEHSLEPDEYRKLFVLEADYPMVAPRYAQHRRELAVKMGLGRPKKPVRRRRRKKSTAEPSSAETGQ